MLTGQSIPSFTGSGRPCAGPGERCPPGPRAHDHRSPVPPPVQPLALRGTILANRIVSSGHDTVMVDDGHVTDRLVAYHRARAAGGVGLIIVQVAGVHETARYTATS